MGLGPRSSWVSTFQKSRSCSLPQLCSTHIRAHIRTCKGIEEQVLLAAAALFHTHKGTYKDTDKGTYKGTYKDTIRTHIRAHVRTHVRAHIRAHIRTYKGIEEQVLLAAAALFHVHTSLHIRTDTYRHK